MGRTVSGRELEAGIKEFAERKQIRLFEEMAKGAHVPKEGAKLISVQESLISKTTKKAQILSWQEVFEPEFKKYAGAKAPTAEIFNKVIERTAKQCGVFFV